METSLKPAGQISIGVGLTIDGKEILGLTKVPGLGGKPEKVEVTDLKDTVKRYINGVKDNGELEFGFNYDNSTATSNYRMVKAMEVDKKTHEVVLTLPDGTKFTYTAFISIGLDGIEVNKPLTFTMTTALVSDITTTDPVTI